MSLERTLQINIAVLVVLSSVMLGLGERNPLLPLLTISAACASIYFTDIKGWIRLSPGAANVAGLAAVAASLWDYQRVTHETQLLALANFLIYLQCVLLFRPKAARIYWMMALLTLLQVAVATVLSTSIWFGLLLVVYLFMALTVLCLFLVHREQSQHEQRVGDLEAGATSPTQGAGRWPLAAQAVHFAPRAQHHPVRQTKNLGLTRHVLGMGASTLLLSGMLFLLVPRTPERAWGESFHGPQRTVGFSETVKLGELGEIVENPEEVMQVKLFTAQDDRYALTDTPLWRGSSLLVYGDGRWTAGSGSRRSDGNLAMLKVEPGLVRCEYRVHRLDTDTLFCIMPAYAVPGDKDTNRNVSIVSGRLRRTRPNRSRVIEYRLLTSGLEDGRQKRYIPANEQYPEPAEDVNGLMQLPAEGDQGDPLRQLKQLAERLVEHIPPEDHERRARALEIHLRSSGKYGYSLVAVARDPQLDPIEDFLFKNRQGHCEYFASALTLMLRSVGVPARMVVGFKGAEWNPLTGAYHVRQLHAHTWVEAYIAPDKLPAVLTRMDPQHSETTSPEHWKHGGWLRLDPTAGTSAGVDLPEEAGLPSLEHVFDYADLLWNGYILSMDARRQREAVYRPIRQALSDLYAMFDAESWQQLYAGLKQLLRGERPADAGPWFSWRAAVVSILVLSMLLGLYRALAWMVRLWRRSAAQRQEKTQAARGQQVEFYRRLEQLLAVRDLHRGAAQTQLEFALAAGLQLSVADHTLAVAAAPRRITEAFYRVRFGQRTLDNHELQAVEQALDDLAGALSDGNGQPPPH